MKNVLDIDASSLPEICSGVRPLIRHYSEILLEDSDSEEDLYLGTSISSEVLNTPVTFSVTKPSISPELMNFVLNRDASRRALYQLGKLYWCEENSVFTIRSHDMHYMSAEEAKKWQDNMEEKFFQEYNRFGRRELTMTSSEFYEKMKVFANKENAGKGNEISIREYPKKFMLVFIGEMVQVDRIYQPCSERHSSLAQDEEIVTKRVLFPSPLHLNLLRSKKYFERLEGVTFFLESSRVSIEGQSYKVKHAKEGLKSFLSDMKDREIFISHDMVEFFLQGGLKKFDDLLAKNGIEAAVALDTSSYLHILATNGEELNEAVNTYDNSFTTEDVAFSDKESLFMMRSEAMGKWMQEMCSNFEGMLIAKGFGDPSSKQFLLTGFSWSVSSVSDAFNAYLANNVLYEARRQLRTAFVAKFFERFFWKSFSIAVAAEMEEYKAEVSFLGGPRPQILLKATKGGITELGKRVDRELAKIKMEQWNLKKHGLHRYIAVGSYEQDKKIIEDKESVVVSLDEGDDEPTFYAAPQPNSTFVSAFMPSNSPLKRICLYTGDICEHQADAIVNAANESLCHAGGLAARIIKCAGDEVQDESYARLAKLPNGRVPTGDALKTGPGQLHTTKCIIHAVGPEWEGMHQSEDRKRLLLDAVRASMKIASESNFSCIAFPAISAGLYGGLSPVVADVMVKAVDDFFSEIPCTSLESVDFVMRPSDTDNVRCFSSSLDRMFRRAACAPAALSSSALPLSMSMFGFASGVCADAGIAAPALAAPASAAPAASATASESPVIASASVKHSKSESCSFVVRVKSGDIAKQKVGRFLFVALDLCSTNRFLLGKCNC